MSSGERSKLKKGGDNLGNGVTLAKAFNKSIGPEKIILGAHMNICMHARVSSQFVSGNQKVDFLLRGKMTKVLKGINTPVKNVCSKGRENFK